MSNINNTINVDGKNYALDSLSDGVKKLIAIHGKWSQELEETRLEMAKSEAALRDLSREIIEAIGQENPTEVADAEEVTDVESKPVAKKKAAKK